MPFRIKQDDLISSIVAEKARATPLLYSKLTLTFQIPKVSSAQQSTWGTNIRTQTTDWKLSAKAALGAANKVEPPMKAWPGLKERL